MPERNRRTLKLFATLGLLALGRCRRGARAISAPVVESVRTPMSEPVTDPTPPPLRTRSRPRFSAGASRSWPPTRPCSSRAPPSRQSPATRPSASRRRTPPGRRRRRPLPRRRPRPLRRPRRPSRPSPLPPIPRRQPIPTSRPTSRPRRSRRRPRLTPPRRPRQRAAPARCGPRARACVHHAGSTTGRSRRVSATQPAKKWVVQSAAATPASPPEVEHGGDATIWLNRALPDPTPASRRLTRPFARQLVSISRRHHADWAAVLGVLRAQGHRGSAPATRAQS